MANLTVAPFLMTVEGKLRKRKRNYSVLEESIGSNFESTNPIIQLIGGGGLVMETVEECDVLKDVLFDYSRGVFTSIVGDYWSLEFWKYICAEYNQRANSRGLQSCTQENIYAGGTILQSRYCTLTVRGMVDVKLDMIFKPCEDCNLRVVFFPTSEIGGMNYNSNYVFTNSELTTVKNVLLDYSSNILQIQRGDYYSASFWDTLADVYNMRVGTQRGLCAGGNMLRAGMKLQHIFNTQRVSGIIDADLKHIFERCENCKRKIIIFPSSLFSQSDSGFFTTSTMRSFRSGIGNGNANRASTSCGIGNTNRASTSRGIGIGNGNRASTSSDDSSMFQLKLSKLTNQNKITIDELIAFLDFIEQKPNYRGFWTSLSTIEMQVEFIKKVIP